MGKLLQWLLRASEKAQKVDPTDFMTQDTINALIELAKEVIKP